MSKLKVKFLIFFVDGGLDMPTQNFDLEDLISAGVKSTEDENATRLIFPINVHESLQASSGLKQGEKLGIMVSFWLFGCAILGWFLASWLRTILPDYYFALVIIIELVLQLTVGVYLLRFALDERSIFAEMNNNVTTFADYFKIYKEIKAEDSKYPFDILEFDDGSYGVFIECRLGQNTQYRSDNTYAANKAVVEILNKVGLPRKTFYHNESFKSSKAAQDLRDILKGISDPALFSVYRDIVQNYLRVAEEESNVLCVTHLVYASTRAAKDDLLTTLNQLFTALQRDETVYRQVSVLSYDEVVEFLRHYYRLEVLDMGLIRAHIAEKKSDFNCPVKVLKLYGSSGKIYANDEFKKLREEVLSEGGLTSVN